MRALLGQRLLERLATAERFAVLTGAGVSAESGIATFRDPNGLWAQFRPEELASMEGFLANPTRVWQWYQYRRHVIESAQPNPAHIALAKLEQIVPTFTLITQNIDRLHQRAGSQRVLELHGNLEDHHCAQCGRPYQGEISAEIAQPPRCPSCGGLIRPSVVWFGELLPAGVLAEAEHAARTAEIFLVIGTSAEVYPAAGLPLIAWHHGAMLIEVNPTPTHLSSYAHAAIRQKAGVAMPHLVALIEQLRSNC
ncbi:MAG: NAD-dependent deacylase [Candidatus Kapabacteria bacterium]|nr:NAD-dependent deacylase [Candidatus Kapabacteria bacterium]MCS7303305.1 NAD-dependent deacylase [Candidatus Kapabacteria bacterium]MCX7936964.1 NAD-dependent deacylase [Chlorobiota bacterium]